MSTFDHVHPVILSGGSGTRLWPLSRAHYPKQLLPLAGDQTMLQETSLRVAQGQGFGKPTVIANDTHRFIVAEQLQEAGIEWQDLILEPVGRNTAPAAAIAAMRLQAVDENALMLLLASDHVIRDVPAFHAALARAIPAAEAGKLVTFGITPSHPETGYGYVKQGASLTGCDDVFEVAAFVEKPDQAKAERLLAEGGYSWNSGMFLLPVKVYLDELQRLRPDMVDACRKALETAAEDLDFLRLDAGTFAECPSDSIDYAVMEKTDHAAVVPAEFGWNDIGAWKALWDVTEKDANGNVIQADSHLVDVRDSYLRAEDGRLIAAIGVEGLTVVSTDDAVLIAKSDQAAEVKEVVEQLKKDGRPEAVHHRKVYRPWGSYRDIDEEDRFRVKRIVVKPGGVLSLQRHQHRSEHWVIVKGTAKVTCGDMEITLVPNQSTYIPKQTVHRLENLGDEPLHMIEVQVGDYVGEDDIERLEDTYGRSASDMPKG